MASSEDTMVQKPLVMVVESEFIIRLEIVEMITEAGDAIIDTPNAGAAIEILQNSGDINAEFTDIRMPGTLNGMQLAHAIRRRNRQGRLMVTSSPQEMG
jgi:CheY-like chemotaxis protein